MKITGYGLAMLVTGSLLFASSADAQRGRGGGGRGGGGMRGGGGRGSMPSRGSARPSVSSAGRGFSRPAPPVNRGNVNPNISRGNVDRGNVNRGDINRGNVGNGNINRGDNTFNRQVNVGDVNGRGDWYHDGVGCCYRPGAVAAGVAAAAIVTAAAVGSVVYTLPSSCVTTIVNGITYQQCGGTWYEPHFYGTTTEYVVVNAP